MTGSSTSDDDDAWSSEQIDAIFEVLADEHRRQVLRYFLTSETDAASVEDLVDAVLDREEKRPSPARDQLERTFHHITLPKLADSGVVEYDARRRTVTYRGSPVMERLLAVVTESDLLAD